MLQMIKIMKICIKEVLLVYILNSTDVKQGKVLLCMIITWFKHLYHQHIRNYC